MIRGRGKIAIAHAPDGRDPLGLKPSITSKCRSTAIRTTILPPCLLQYSLNSPKTSEWDFRYLKNLPIYYTDIEALLNSFPSFLFQVSWHRAHKRWYHKARGVQILQRLQDWSLAQPLSGSVLKSSNSREGLDSSNKVDKALNHNAWCRRITSTH